MIKAEWTNKDTLDLQPTFNQFATDCISRRRDAIDAIVGKGAIGDSEVECLFCGHHIGERPFEVYCNIMCKWVNEKDYCTMFEPAHTMEEFEKEVVDAECVMDNRCSRQKSER